MYRRVLAFACLLCLVGSQALAQAFGGPGPGPEPQPAPASPNGPVFLQLAPASASDVGAARTLLQKAVGGPVRIIAGLKLSLASPDMLSGGAAAAQRRALRTAQDRVVSRVLGRTAATGRVTRFETIPFVSMFVDAAALRRLLADPEVANIQEDVPLPPTLLESVPRINADDVWAAGFPGTNYSIAVLDTGVDKTHPMLAGKVVSEACYSTEDPTNRIQSLCPGRVTESTEPGSGANCTGIIGCEHGTHVAGIAAGKPMPVSGETGVAKSTRLIAVQVFSRFNRARDCAVGPPCLAAFHTDIIKGLERVYALRTQRNIAAVNMSLSGGFFYNFPCDMVQPAMTAVIKSLRLARTATIIAAGNGGSDAGMQPPGCISAAISVGSTLDAQDTLSAFSNHAPQVRLLAPGSGIASSVPGGGIATLNGTSMAAPHVAGAFALLRDVYGPSTVNDISAALECTGVPVTRANIVRPRIDVGAARNFLLDPPNTTRFWEFDHPADAAAWTVLMGRFHVDSGSYWGNRTPGWKISSLASCNENLAIEARLRRVNGFDPNQHWNTGIFFKAQLHPTAKIFSGYFAGYNTFGGGQVFLNRLHGYDLKVLNGGFAHSLCTKPVRLGSNSMNTLRVVSTGGIHRVYFNGVLACNVLDQTYGVGRVALASYLPDPASGHWFEVDSVLIDPNETVPPPPAPQIARR
jgi:subtilisin family serine protease